MLAVVFAAGFALGVLRTLLVAPRFGDLPAVALELPVMLAISWVVCGKVLSRFEVPSDTASRFSMGAVAFGLLMFAEITLSVGLFGRSMSEHFDALTTTHGLLGLTGQVLFGLMPLVRRRR